MSTPLDVDGSALLAIVERSGFPESRHLGAAALVDPDGAVVRALGDPAALVYPRSTLKLAQATAVELLGVVFDPEQTVLSAASHSGTRAHVAVVERMLADAGLDASALRCPADWPGDPVARRAASEPARITMNCSGKHAGFLAAAVAHGWELESYLDPEHPLQRHVLATVEELAGERITHLGVDGCGAPVPVLSLAGLARTASRTARAGTALGDAIRAHPWALDGPGRANTVTIERTGLVAKLGAEGVLVLVTDEGAAVAVKALDGAHRATTPTGLELLVREGLLPRGLADAALTAIADPWTTLRLAF
ncbi:asparaginase [Protaetiibacter intestinalis]|uniref:Asparaginase n=1 Tax=Protaetiibacter intestinalis TaxID=2419774 RepID=A0A387BAC0_9MICO|nr:asparaginase [Protaetiibacter intestinalis]AYF98841.1 asparaginase [Protaetiibacter intestinalis]